MQPLTESLGLSGISRGELNQQNEQLLGAAAAVAGGPRSFQARKIAETRDLLMLSQIAPPGRLTVEALNLGGDLLARLRLRVPVAYLRPMGGADPVQVGPEAVLRLQYPEAAVRMPQPGYRFVQIQSPLGVWHANVSLDPLQALCLGAKLPAGIRVTELVLLSYAALSLQSITLDLADPAGVLNPHAAAYWQFHADRVPLTRTPFLGAVNHAEGSHS